MMLTNYSIKYYTFKSFDKNNDETIVQYQQMLDVYLRKINCNCMRASYFINIYYLYIIHNIISTQICTIWDNEQWKSDINSKSTLKVYRHRKKQIQEEHIYSNHPSSVIWYKARINALQLNDRNRHTNKETRCIICENEIENKDIYHFILYCPAYNTERSEIPELQQPYNNNNEGVLGHFPFHKEVLIRRNTTYT